MADDDKEDYSDAFGVLGAMGYSKKARANAKKSLDAQRAQDQMNEQDKQEGPEFREKVMSNNKKSTRQERDKK